MRISTEIISKQIVQPSPSSLGWFLARNLVVPPKFPFALSIHELPAQAVSYLPSGCRKISAHEEFVHGYELQIFRVLSEFREQWRDRMILRKRN